MTRREIAVVILLGVLLGLAAGMIGTEKACEAHDPQGNLRGTALECRQ